MRHTTQIMEPRDNRFEKNTKSKYLYFKWQVDISMTSKPEYISLKRKQTSKSTSDLRLNQYRCGLGVGFGN